MEMEDNNSLKIKIGDTIIIPIEEGSGKGNKGLGCSWPDPEWMKVPENLERYNAIKSIWHDDKKPNPDDLIKLK